MLPNIEASLFRYSLIADILQHFNSYASKVIKKGKELNLSPLGNI
jgi:hypothetical protein